MRRASRNGRQRGADDDIDADYIVDEKAKTATLTARGVKKAERVLQHRKPVRPRKHRPSPHHINQAIKAHGIMQARHRLRRQGRRGHHRRRVHRPSDVRPPLSARACTRPSKPRKHVEVARESKTLATITFQNYFRLYGKLSGMTGTALTEEEEFSDNLQASTSLRFRPTSPSSVSTDPDVVYKTEEAKYPRRHRADRRSAMQRGQPVLVGTVSIEKIRTAHRICSRREGIKHKCLEREEPRKGSRDRRTGR